MSLPCSNCNMADFCQDLGRCYFENIDHREIEGELTDVEEVNEPMLKKAKPVKVPEKIEKAHRDFLKDVLNY